jgi:hypothetical protein
MAAGCDIFLIDFICRPFAKIAGKMPFVMMAVLMLIYGIIGYVVFRSAYMSGEQH